MMRRFTHVPLPLLALLIFSLGCDSSGASGGEGPEPPQGSHALTATLDGAAFTAHVVHVRQLAGIVQIAATDTLRAQTIGLRLPDSYEGEVVSGAVEAHMAGVTASGDLEMYKAVAGNVSLDQRDAGQVAASFSMTLEPFGEHAASKTTSRQLVGELIVHLAMILDPSLLDKNGFIGCTLWFNSQKVYIPWDTGEDGLFIASPQVGENASLHGFSVQGQTFGPWVPIGSDRPQMLGPRGDPMDVSFSLYLGVENFALTGYEVGDPDVQLSFWLHLENRSEEFDFEANRERGDGTLKLHVARINQAGRLEAYGSFNAMLDNGSGGKIGCVSGEFVIGDPLAIIPP